MDFTNHDHFNAKLWWPLLNEQAFSNKKYAAMQGHIEIISMIFHFNAAFDRIILNAVVRMRHIWSGTFDFDTKQLFKEVTPV